MLTCCYGAGFTVLLFDLRNRGESGGEFVSFGFFEQEDALAAVDYLNSRDDLNELRIGMLGLSQGGAAAIFAAAASRRGVGRRGGSARSGVWTLRSPRASPISSGCPRFPSRPSPCG